MGNTFITMQNIARQTLMRLHENLVLPNLCYRDYSSDFSDLGDTIQVKKPVVLEAKSFKDGDTVQRQDMKESSVAVKLDKIATVDVKWGAIEGATNLTEAKLQTDFIEPAAVALAEKINRDGLALYSQIPGVLGTAGTTPNDLAALSAIRKYLNKNKAPLTNRRAVWDVEADAKLSEIPNLTRVSEAGTPQTLREGEIGRLFGLDNYMSQGVLEHAVGATGTVLIDGAATKGATKLHVDGLTTAFKVGDRFTIAGDATSYVVTGAGALETADQDIEIAPALQKAAADNAAVTVGGAYTANIAFHQNAIAFVTRPLMLPKGVEAYVASDEYNGVSVRVYRGFNTETKQEVMSMDVLYGYKLIYPELACVYMG